MAEVKDCPGFETFGEDVRSGREAQGMTRKVLAEKVGVSSRYLANIELGLIVPSVPVMLQLIRICHLPVERYFNPNLVQENSEVRRRVRHKTQLCPEKYLPIVEATLDGAINMKEKGSFDYRISGLYSYVPAADFGGWSFGVVGEQG